MYIIFIIIIIITVSTKKNVFFVLKKKVLIIKFQSESGIRHHKCAAVAACEPEIVVLVVSVPSLLCATHQITLFFRLIFVSFLALFGTLCHTFLQPFFFGSLLAMFGQPLSLSFHAH